MSLFRKIAISWWIIIWALSIVGVTSQWASYDDDPSVFFVGYLNYTIVYSLMAVFTDICLREAER